MLSLEMFKAEVELLGVLGKSLKGMSPKTADHYLHEASTKFSQDSWQYAFIQTNRPRLILAVEADWIESQLANSPCKAFTAP